MCIAISVCYFSTADWLNIGQMQRWPHYLPLLFGCCSVGYLLVIGAIKTWKRNPESKGIRSTITKFVSPLLKKSKTDGEISSQREHKGHARVWSAIFCTVLVGSWGLWAATAITDHQEIRTLKAQLAKYDASTVVQHNFVDLGRLADGDFSYYSDEDPQGGTWRPCATDKHNGVDTVEILKQGIGFEAREARWEERGVCKSILRADLGFDWRNAENKFKYAKVQ